MDLQASRRAPFGPCPVRASLSDRHDVIRAHFDLVVAEEEPKVALHKLRTFTGWYTHGLPEGKHLRARIGELQTPQAFLEAVASFFSGAMRTAA
jgi:tRNA-dihydrouridine synthase